MVWDLGGVYEDVRVSVGGTTLGQGCGQRNDLKEIMLATITTSVISGAQSKQSKNLCFYSYKVHWILLGETQMSSFHDSPS